MATRRGRSPLDPAKIDARLLHRGAEADLFLTELEPWKAVIKRRVRKRYRNPQLDSRIRSERTVREASALQEAKQAGVSAPSLLQVNLQDCSIAMTFLAGNVARDRLDHLANRECSEVLHQIGQQIGRLHRMGLVHGDVTTSNIMLLASTPFILDFGMSSHSTAPEDRGVDLHLLQRSLSTSHTINARLAEKAIREGYRSSMGERKAALTFRKQREISRRGRYFAIR